MPFKKRKSKAVETPEGYKQSQITDFFRQSSVVNRKLFIDECTKQKMQSYRGKIVDSDDEFDDHTKKVTLPVPLSSDDEESGDTGNPISTGKKNEKEAKEKLLEKEKVNNKNANQELIPTASSTPLKKNSRCDDLTSANQSSGNVNVLENVRLTPKRTHESSLAKKQPFLQETLLSPCKKSKMEVTLTEDPYLKVHIDEEIPIAGSSSGGVKYMITEDSPSSQTKKAVFQASTSPTKKLAKINGSKSPKLSPSRRTNGTPKQLKERDSFNSVVKPEEEDEKLNFSQLDLLKKLFVDTMENKDKKDLLTEADIEIVREFLELDVNHQYFLIKLFLYLPKWYNMNQFCIKIKLDQKLSGKEIRTMYEYHKNSRFLYTDLSQLGTDELLNLLMIGNLRTIATQFKLNKKKFGKKSNLINYLKANCKTQSILREMKSSEDLLKKRACDHLGYCIKLKEEVKSSFEKVYVLQTYSNSSYYKDVQSYLKDLNYSKVVYPNYLIESYKPFISKEQFLRYYEAIEIEKELLHAFEINDNVTIKNLCDGTFRKLQSIEDDGKWKRYLPDYLQKFSAEYRYIAILNRGIRKHSELHFESVRTWLEFLIEQYPTRHAIGFWYKQLAHIILRHYKNYESAAKKVIEAFEFNKRENIFDLLQIYELNNIATKLRSRKSYKLCRLYCDQLIALTESIDTNKFPKKLIKGCTDRREGKSGKRIYFYRDSNDEVSYGSVENITMRHYLDEEGYEGIHCEGKLIAILFTLFFWDIIYHYYVPRTFISKLQSVPLDMYSVSFYEHRKNVINKRLDEIASGWSDFKVEKFLTENWDNHSHEKSLTDFDGLGKELKDILIMYRCMDRGVLSKVLGRLATNYKIFRSGLPDLFLWNAQLSKCKFVEVKGENDSLQPNQILWIQYLIDVGAEVEVCHVSGVGAKSVTTEGENKKKMFEGQNE